MAAALLAAELAAVTAAALLQRVEGGMSPELAAHDVAEGLRQRVTAEGLPPAIADEMAGYVRDVAGLLESELLAATYPEGGRR
jgi:hypothetical protein